MGCVLLLLPFVFKCSTRECGGSLSSTGFILLPAVCWLGFGTKTPRPERTFLKAQVASSDHTNQDKIQKNYPRQLPPPKNWTKWPPRFSLRLQNIFFRTRTMKHLKCRLRNKLLMCWKSNLIIDEFDYIFPINRGHWIFSRPFFVFSLSLTD